MGNEPRYPGLPEVINGNGAVAHVMRHVCGGVIGYPITPSTEISETFEAYRAEGQLNVWGKHPFFVEAEGEHSAQSGALGAALTGGNYISNASSSQGILYALESHYVTAGKKIGGFVLQVAARVVSKHSLNVMAGHDDIYALLPAGYTILFGSNPQEAADLAAISYKVSAESLIPVANTMDGFATSHVMSEVLLPEPELLREYLGDPAGRIQCPTVAQEILFGAKGRTWQLGEFARRHGIEMGEWLNANTDAIERDDRTLLETAPVPQDLKAAFARAWKNAWAKGTRQRVPALVDVNNPGLTGPVQNQPDFQAGAADHRTHFASAVPAIVRAAMAEYSALTGREYSVIQRYGDADAEEVLVALGSITDDIQAVLPHLQAQGRKVAVVSVKLLSPFPEEEFVAALAGAKSVTIMERSEDTALTRLATQALYRAGVNVPLTTAIYGLGGHDVQPRDLVAAFDNTRARMSGGGAPLVYLGSRFFTEGAQGSLAELQEKMRAAYPGTELMQLETGENPQLLPEQAIRIRFHSVGGYGTIATGKLLTDILSGVLGMRSKSAPKYGSEKSGAATNYYITLSPEPVLLTNAELEDVEVVIAPDHMVFHHTNPLKGLVDGGTFIMQSAEEPLAVWESLPGYARDYIVRHQIKFLVIDAFAVAKKHAPTPELQTRMMGIAFIGAILGHVDKVSAQASGDVMALVEHEIEKKFGRKGRKVVDSNMAVIRDGEAAVVTVDYASYPDKAAAVSARSMKASSTTCPMASEPRVSGLFDPAYYEDIAARPFREGAISNSPVFPGAGLFMPVGTGVAKDKGIFRRTVPIFDADKCTACMECALVCPDAAIPNTVHELEDLLDLATRSCDFAQDDGVGVVQDKGIAEDATPDRHLATDFSPTRHLARSEAESLDLHRWAEAMRAELLAGKSPAEACQAGDVPDDWKTLAKAFFTHYPVAVTKPIFVAPEKENPGSGALYAAVVDPWKCTGCLQCVEVCGPGALTATDQDEQVLDDLAARFAWHSELPDTPKRFTEMAIREGGDRKRVLLNRDYYYAMTGGHGACRGCGEVTATRLLLALSHALGDEKRSAHIKELETVLAQLDAYAGAGLAHTETQNPTTQGQSERGLAPSNPGLDPSVPGSAQSVPGLDPERAQTTNYPEEIKEELEHWLYLYEGGPTGRGPSSTVIANATGCSSVYASTMPFQPFTDPWVNSLFQDAQAVSVGLFEGIASALTQEIKALRRAKALVNGEPAPDVDTIGWRDFTKEELSLMPNVLSIGGDGASYDIGFGAMSKVLASGTPVKMLVLDTGAYSNTGGQSSTASYTGQDADLARYGKAHKGKREHRKELGLIAAMHPNVYSCATSTALHSHYLQTVLDMLGYLDGAALMVTYTACGTENGVPEQLANARSELAVRSRMAPVFTHDPRRGESLAERFSLEGNPDERSLWTTSTIEYVDASGSLQLLTTPLTPAEFALGEGRFAKQFKKITDEGADLVPIAEYVELENRAGKTPFVYATDGKRHLIKVACSDAIVALVEDRAHYWRTLQYLAGFPIQELDAEFQAQVEQLKARYDEGLRGREGALDDIAAAMVELVNAKAPKPGPAPVDIDEVAGALVELTTSKTELSGFAYGGRAAEPASTGEEQASEKQAPPIWLDPADEAKCVDCATCYQDLPMFFEKTTIIARGAAQSVAHFKGYDGTAITPALKAKINKVKANCDAGIIQ